MNINFSSLRLHSSIGGISDNNPLFRGRLVIADDKNAMGDVQTQTALAKKRAQADQLDLLEEARKLAEELKAESERKDDENESKKITTQTDEKPTGQEQALKDMEPGDLSGILMPDNEKVAEKFSAYQGSGNATTSQEVDEEFAGKEHWMFSFGRDIDLKAAGMGSQWSISSGKAAEDGYGMRARYETSSDDNTVIIVEALNGEGNKTAYRVDLKEIDAANASLVESFALVSHLYMGQGKTEEVINPLDALRLMNNIIDQPRYDPSKTEGVTYSGNGYSVTTQTKSGVTTTDGRPNFDDHFNLLSFAKKPEFQRPEDGSFMGRITYM